MVAGNGHWLVSGRVFGSGKTVWRGGYLTGVPARGMPKGSRWNFFENHLRDHSLGHVLLYLRKPRASNECRDALKEWRKVSLFSMAVGT